MRRALSISSTDAVTTRDVRRTQEANPAADYPLIGLVSGPSRRLVVCAIGLVVGGVTGVVLGAQFRDGAPWLVGISLSAAALVGTGIAGCIPGRREPWPSVSIGLITVSLAALVAALLTRFPNQNVTSTLAGTVAIIVALATASTVLVSREAIREDEQRSRRVVGTDSLWRLWQQWDSDELLKLRAHVATNLLKSPPLFTARTGQLLNFFERLGYLVCVKEVVDVGDAWHNFSPWVIAYWHRSLPYLETAWRHDRRQAQNYRSLIEAFQPWQEADEHPTDAAQAAKVLGWEARIWPPPEEVAPAAIAALTPRSGPE